jgi:hypothetical protein
MIKKTLKRIALEKYIIKKEKENLQFHWERNTELLEKGTKLLTEVTKLQVDMLLLKDRVKKLEDKHDI